MADSYLQVTSDDFAEKVLGASNLTVVQFSMENSAACTIQDPEFEVISQEYRDKATFAKCMLSGRDAFAEQWNINSVPTIIFFKNGQEVYRITGIVMRDRFRRQLEGILLVN